VISARSALGGFAAVWFGSIAGCAGSKPVAKTPSPIVAEGTAVTPVELDRLHELAPDYLARAERAEQRASEAATAEVASEHHACAQLLLQAAAAEADRVELERQLLAEEVRRDAVLRELAREEYARLALQQSGHFVAAEPVVNARLGSVETQRTAADAYIRRARLSLAAARVLGAEPAALAQAERRVREAGVRPAQARTALEQAERVLDAARAKTPKSDRPQAPNPPSQADVH
jgi:hypothetical protein